MPMKTRLSAICLTLTATTNVSCHEKKTEDAPWILDRFDDIKILRYEVPGFAELPLREKELIYYLAEAAKWRPRHHVRPEFQIQPSRAPHVGGDL